MTASGASVATVHRAPPKALVQVYRKVPDFQLLAATGAPTNAPISAGITWKRAAVSVNECPAIPLNVRACWPMSSR